jgi:uncharacterized delta-60 repeat protein
VDASPSSEEIRDLAVVAGGKIVVAGYAEVNLTPAFAVARLLPGGKLDHTFAGDGLRTTDVSEGSDLAFGVAEQPDGKIVVVGLGGRGGANDWGVVRYGRRGTLDDTFSGNGIVVTRFGPSYEFAASVQIQGNGKIVVAGRVHRGATGDDLAVLRYKPGGGIDDVFGGGDGRVVTDVDGGSDTARGVALQANGKIVIAGEAQVGAIRRFVVARYLAS